MGFDPNHSGRVRGPNGKVEAGSAANVEEHPTIPSGELAHGSPNTPERIGREILQFVGLWVLPDVRAGTNGRTWQDQIRTSPAGVWNLAATMPGVPFGATHSTLKSSNGISTLSSSHSLTRRGSPAISRQAKE